MTNVVKIGEIRLKQEAFELPCNSPLQKWLREEAYWLADSVESTIEKIAGRTPTEKTDQYYQTENFALIRYVKMISAMTEHEYHPYQIFSSKLLGVLQRAYVPNALDQIRDMNGMTRAAVIEIKSKE